MPFLPTTTQEFTKIRRERLLYVDKTDLVYELTHGADRVIFFSRPRRFGKSLLISTLEAYFNAQKEYFEGLRMMDLETEWKQYEVLRFDLSGCNTSATLEDKLDAKLRFFEEKYRIKNRPKTLGVRFGNVIESAANGDCKVVVLFDEYDYPLQHTLFSNAKEHEACKVLYRDFFCQIKEQDKYIHFTFLTGITKFTQLSLFSVLTTIKIMGHWEKFQALCGFTKEEVRTTLRPYVLHLAEKLQLTEEETYEAIRSHYDGYHFCENGMDIYNPFSLLNALSDLCLRDYWNESGLNKMLMDAVDTIGWDDTDFENILVYKRELESSDVNTTDLALFMYQSGYLTIKNSTKRDYILGVPNMEVKYAIGKQILPRLVVKKPKDVDSNIRLVYENLESLNIAEAMEALKALVADTPYSQDNTAKGMEEKFQFIIKNAMYLAGCYVDEEKRMINGRADLVARHDACILIIELKMRNNGGLSAAEQQIRIQNYDAPYLAQSKPIFAVALEFDTEARCMTNYSVTPVK